MRILNVFLRKIVIKCGGSDLRIFGVMLCLVMVGSIVACQPAIVIAKFDDNHRQSARSYEENGACWVEVNIPHIAGVNSCDIEFENADPPGLTKTVTPGATVIKWIVPGDRITWFGSNGYKIKIKSGQSVRKLEVRLIKRATQVVEWVIGVVGVR